jgi:hypothetical protein
VNGTWTLLLLGLPCITLACSGKQAHASFPVTDTPVLLGPVDRIGGGTALSTQTVGRYDNAASQMEVHTENSRERTMKTRETLDGYMDKKLFLEHQPGPNHDLRVQELNVGADSSAWILLLMGVYNANAFVGVHGDVVTTKGASK